MTQSLHTQAGYFPETVSMREAQGRARVLAWIGVGWHALEGAVAIASGVVAGSIALVGFGADSLVELAAGGIVLWRFADARAHSDEAEHRAHRLIALTFWAIAIYVLVEAARTLAGVTHPDTSWVGIGLAAVTLVTMPALAAAKARVGERLDSHSVKSEGRQNLVCAYLSLALLLGLGANAAFGAWWADPAAAVIVAIVAANEGRRAWSGGHSGDCC
jgi:divalent metal cation (Fe/Co/Zn/Cd) transporter